MIAGLPQYAQWIAWAIVLVVSIRMDGLFCGLETGIYVMNKNRLDLHAESGLHAAKFLKQMLASPDRLLTTLLMGTNIVRYLSRDWVQNRFTGGSGCSRARACFYRRQACWDW